MIDFSLPAWSLGVLLFVIVDQWHNQNFIWSSPPPPRSQKSSCPLALPLPPTYKMRWHIIQMSIDSMESCQIKSLVSSLWYFWAPCCPNVRLLWKSGYIRHENFLGFSLISGTFLPKFELFHLFSAHFGAISVHFLCLFGSFSCVSGF